ncbi:MAG TPA: hypothetical protein VJS64_11455 [Pyrinomonadaceae bacterium]|nr:hypothetical protein [Pyrinomonadaceae bacterium]
MQNKRGLGRHLTVADLLPLNLATSTHPLTADDTDLTFMLELDPPQGDDMVAPLRARP